MISVECESWPLAEPFTISRGTKTAADVVLVTIKEGGRSGRGECVPYRHYGETVQSVVQQINDTIPMLAGDFNRTALQALLPPGAARKRIGLRVVGPGSENEWKARLGSCRDTGPWETDLRIHLESGFAGTDASRGQKKRAPASVESEGRCGRSHGSD